MSKILRCNVCGDEEDLFYANVKRCDRVSVEYYFKNKSAARAILDICPKCALDPDKSEKEFSEILNVIEVIIRGIADGRPNKKARA